MLNVGYYGKLLTGITVEKYDLTEKTSEKIRIVE